MVSNAAPWIFLHEGLITDLGTVRVKLIEAGRASN
jgi:hypothetical protein